ncbi:MAG TPA: hypothetical protein VLT62_30125 [Candidatus Methylomirabilis sp.]|nr:hypothetical protein [Candidatus Methylomirabilis sp.]
MRLEESDLKLRQRRWNAAALQRYLKRRSLTGFRMYSRDLQAAARDIEGELCGSTNALELVRQAWEHLILTGLVVVDTPPGEDYAWRLADAPAHPCLTASTVGVWQ